MNPCFAKSIHGIQHLMRFEIVLLVIHGARNPGEYCAKIIQGYFTGTGAIPSGGFTITNSTTQWYAYFRGHIVYLSKVLCLLSVH